MGLYFLKFITAFDLLFLLKLRWPKNKFDPFFAFSPSEEPCPRLKNKSIYEIIMMMMMVVVNISFLKLNTAISRKVVGESVHPTIPKGNMGYDRYTVPDDCSCRTYFFCFPLALANTFSWPFVPILSNFSEER